MKLRGIIFKITNEIMLYPIVFKKKKSSRITVYLFLCFKLSIIRA